VAYAKQFLGCKYVYGGTSPSGFDCSGFTQYVYKHFGISLNRTAAAQYSNGTSVTNLQAGDLVMFGTSGINHVGIYIGENSFIHAANTNSGVTIDSLSSSYYKANYVGARRIF
jgi:cell wall-associated NlpC family hydrolase